MGKERICKALPYYELGINADPAFASNYYRAALVYFSTTEEIWAMMYGEIFMNLDRNSTRTEEISKLLYDTYKSEIKFTSDTSFSVSFSDAIIVIADNKSPFTTPLPYGKIYESALSLALAGERTIDLSMLNRVRQRFVEYYFKNKFNEKYPNVLFDYQKKLIDAGHFEAYNYWLLMKGEEVTFKLWYAANQDKFDKFVAWFNNNPIQITDVNKLTRKEY